MQKNFWNELKRPFSVLAPMEDVTDTAFRQVMRKANPSLGVVVTEFTSVDGIEYMLDKINQFPISNDQLKANKVLQRLVRSDDERPVVAQIWGKDPEKFLKAAKLVAQLGFDGVDINMGCPDKAVLKQGCGAALSRTENRALVKEIVMATKEGAGGLPVSVKTRLGDRGREEGWVEFLLGQNLQALTIHGRTAKEMSLVEADWGAIGEVVKLANEKQVRTLIIGNGDIKSMDDPRIAQSGVDGVMVGRGVFENPWIFEQCLGNRSQRIELLKYHLELWDELWRNPKTRVENQKYFEHLRDYETMKRFFKMYIRDFDGAAELRAEMMGTKTVLQAQKVILTHI